jgi:hypothetical protein
MVNVDFTKCPCCGEVEDFEVQTDERLYGSSSIRVEANEDGSLKGADSFDTDIGWSTAKVLGYYASCCMNSLPDEYQVELDRVLEIEREKKE